MARKFLLVILTLLVLVGCSPPVMPDNVWDEKVSVQIQRAAAAPVCCNEWSELHFLIPEDGENLLRLSADDQVMHIEGRSTPVIGIDLHQETAAQFLEFVSYSEKRRHNVPFNRALFMRPSLVWLDEHFEELSRIEDPSVCWGHKRWRQGLWGHFPVPKGSRFVVIYPSIADPVQPIDTRMGTDASNMMVVGIVGMAVADKRKTYHGEVRMGLEGDIGIEFSEAQPSPKGVCRVNE